MSYSDLMQGLQDALRLSDGRLADYLQTDVTTVRRVRGGTAEIPVHTKLLLLERVGLIRVDPLLLSIFPQAVQKKLRAALAAEPLSPDLKKALALFVTEVARSH